MLAAAQILNNSRQIPGQPPSYVDMLSANRVKTAVLQVRQEQKQAAFDKASVVICGFPEEGNDQVQLQKFLEFLNCPSIISSQCRIGHSINSASTNPCPIKIQLRSSSEANLLLSTEKNIRREEYYSDVYISKWHSQEEMNDEKLLCQQCDALNKQQLVATKD